MLDYGMEGQTITNMAEIAAADNALDEEDVDSTPDTDPSNDPADEDDIDGVDITLGNELDLAIDKMLLTEAPYRGGDELEYVLTIANEGDVVAYDVDLVDYLGTGLSFDPSHAINTTYNRTATGDYAMTTIDEILTGQVAKVHIVVTIDEMFAGETVTNTAEIAAADDDTNPDNEPPTDRDSTPDTDPTNDPVTEDDIDDVMVPVGQVIDLAIDKRVNTTATP